MDWHIGQKVINDRGTVLTIERVTKTQAITNDGRRWLFASGREVRANKYVIPGSIRPLTEDLWVEALAREARAVFARRDEVALQKRRYAEHMLLNAEEAERKRAEAEASLAVIEAGAREKYARLMADGVEP